jgi:transcriptional regulator GlxA family with amidase domain
MTKTLWLTGSSSHEQYGRGASELRITEARRLLQHTELSQVDVLVACGFVSPSHFSKCYSAYFGYRPSRETRLVK